MEKEYWRSEDRPRRAAAAAAVAAVSSDGKDRGTSVPAIWKSDERNSTKTAHRIRANNGRFMAGAVPKKRSKGEHSSRKGDHGDGEARKERGKAEAGFDEEHDGSSKGDLGREPDKKRKRSIQSVVKSPQLSAGELKEGSHEGNQRQAKKVRSKPSEKSVREGGREGAAVAGEDVECEEKGEDGAPGFQEIETEGFSHLESSSSADVGGAGTAAGLQQLHAGTIGAIRAVLRCYAPRDPLDEDEIVLKVARHRDDTILRRRKRRAEEDPFSAYYSSSDEMDDIMGAPDTVEAAPESAPPRGGLFDAIIARRRTRLTDFDEEMDQAGLPASGGIDPAFFRSIIAAASAEAAKLKDGSDSQAISDCSSQEASRNHEKEISSSHRTLSIASKPASLSSISVGLDQKTVATLRRKLGMLGDTGVGATLGVGSASGFPTTNPSSEVAALLDLKGVIKKKRRRLAASPVPGREGGKGELSDEIPASISANEAAEIAVEGLEVTDATGKPNDSAEPEAPEPPSSTDADPGAAGDGVVGAASSSRRLTRGMARDNRLRRREERDIRENMGLDALVFAANEIELVGSDAAKAAIFSKKAQKDSFSNSTTVTKGARKAKKKKGILSPLHETKRDEKSVIASSDEGDAIRPQWKEGMSNPEETPKNGESSSSSSIEEAAIATEIKTREPPAVAAAPFVQEKERKGMHESSNSKVLDAEGSGSLDITGAAGTTNEARASHSWSLSNAWKGSKNPHLIALLETTDGEEMSESLPKHAEQDTKSFGDNATALNPSARATVRVVRVVVGGEVVAVGPPKRLGRREGYSDAASSSPKVADRMESLISSRKPSPYVPAMNLLVTEQDEDKAPSLSLDKTTNYKKEATVSRQNKPKCPRKPVPVVSKKKSKLHPTRVADGVKLGAPSPNKRPAILRDPVFVESVWVSGTDGTLESPVSLSLLDWRRRQQKTPQTKQKATKNRVTDDEAGDDLVAHNRQVTHVKPATGPVLIPTAVGTAKIDAGLPMWESINPYSDVAKQAAATEPARRRHADATYASWCSGLINCLNGSGRSMARYEFFYSDIDRAWFNSSQFDIDLVNMGVPKSAKLSRSEWSAVRRRLPNRPRRFSRSFIQGQLAELERYRRWVRTVQTDRERAPPAFDHEVPAPIKVGTTVSAYNKTARILHRGIVLSHDTDRSRYLVQFERKELGYEYCPDTEVARHGVPDLMVPACQTSVDGSYVPGFTVPHVPLGSLPYGTCYGPLFGFNAQEAPAGTDELPEGVDETRQQENSNDIVNSIRSSRLLATGAAGEGTMSVVKKVAERETLSRLMGTLEDMTRRKEMILDILKKFHDFFEKETTGAQSLSSPNPSLDDKELKIVNEHYIWLHGNLQLNNERLEAALVHLKLLYGNVYAGGHRHSIQASQNKGSTYSGRREGEADDCLRAVSEKSLDVSKKVWNSIKPTLNGNGRPSEKEEVSSLPYTPYLENRAIGAGSFLLVVRYLEHRTRLRAKENSVKAAHMEVQNPHGPEERKVLKRMLDYVRPTARLPPNMEHFNSARDKEFEALSEALSMLDGELAAVDGET